MIASVFLCSAALAADDVLLHLPLDGESRVIKAAIPDDVRGVYYPTSEADQDKAEFSDPSNYRVPGHSGRALAFRRDLQSRAEIEGWALQQAQSQLCVSLWIKPTRHHIGTLISCKTDSDTDGFALFVWGHRLRFQFGDGNKAYVVEAKGSLYTRAWRRVEARFDKGVVTLLLDGRVLGTEDTGAEVITPGTRGLVLGSYPVPGRGRKAYAYEGALDEITVSLTPALAADQRDEAAQTPALEVLAEPIAGNDQHFGAPMFHTFYGRPAPLSFLFRGDAERCEDPAFVLYLPKGMRLREGFSSNHNGLDQVVKFESTETAEGLTRLETTGYDLTHKLGSRYGRGEILTVALDADPDSVTEGAIQWAVENGGTEGPREQAVVRFLEPLDDDYTKGEFEIMAWSFADDIAFFDARLFQDVVDLYKSSGIWAKGRWYAGDHNPRGRRALLDLLLRDQGFTLYDVSLWHGPIGSSPRDDVPPATLRKGGKPDPKHLCPTAMLTSESFRAWYEDLVASRLAHPQEGDWVAIDFEPWGFPTKICYCPRCLDRFRERFPKAAEATDDDLRKSIWDYQNEWAIFWTQQSADIIAMMVEAVHKVDPDLKVVDYTYAFKYDSDGLKRRFWSIPKDPRLIEKVVDESMLSFYHFNDREAFDMLATSLRHLQKPVSVIVSLSRANAQQGGYTTPEESLSPQRLKQKILLCTAQGVPRVNLFPGRYIDGMFHLAMGEASRLIWQHERFYLHGTRADDLLTLGKASGEELDHDDAAYTVWTSGDQALLTLFNFTDEATTLTAEAAREIKIKEARDAEGAPVTADDGLRKLSVELPPHGVRLLLLDL